MKRNRKVILLMLLVLLCIALLATGTYAAYIRLVSVKRVIIAKGSGSEFCFSSNYLEVKDKDSDQYTPRTIIATDDGFTIHLDIYNFPPTNIDEFSKDDIEYTFTVELLRKDETSNKNQDDIKALLSLDDSFFTKQTIEGGAARTKSYSIKCLASNMEELRKYQKIRIIATPTAPSALSGLNKVLAADFVLASSSKSTPWEGKLIENTSDTGKEYDAFNFELTGTAKETRVLTWNPGQVALSPWSLKDLPAATGTSTSGSVTLDLGGEGKPTSYLLQFYKVNDFNGSPEIILK